MLFKVGQYYIPLENLMYVQDMEDEIRIYLREHRTNMPWLTLSDDEARLFRAWLGRHAADVLEAGAAGVNGHAS